MIATLFLLTVPAMASGVQPLVHVQANGVRAIAFQAIMGAESPVFHYQGSSNLHPPLPQGVNPSITLVLSYATLAGSLASTAGTDIVALGEEAADSVFLYSTHTNIRRTGTRIFRVGIDGHRATVNQFYARAERMTAIIEALENGRPDLAAALLRQTMNGTTKPS